MDWLVLAADAVEAAPKQEGGVTQSQLLLAIVSLVGCVVFLWKWNEARTTKQIEEAKIAATKAAEDAKKAAEEAQKKCEEDRTRLIERLDQKDTKIEALHADAKEVITGALQENSKALFRLGDKQDDMTKAFTETIRSVKCLHQSGQHGAVKP